MMKMRKCKTIRLFALLLTFALLTALLTGCGSSGGNAAQPEGATADQYAAIDTGAAAGSTEAGDYGFAAPGESGSEESAASAPTQRPEDAKLIYTGNLSLECTDLDAAMSGLESLVAEHGGYLESQEVYHESSWQNAHYTVRVPSGQYDAFLNAVTSWEGCTVTYQNSSVEDVGEVYADIENRLETLSIKLDRLQNLLTQAENMEDIITIENAISEVESEIESLSGQKNRYDSLIDYSTIYIDLQQVSTLSEGVNPTLGQRLSQGFIRGVQGFADGCANFLVWIVSHLIGVLIFLAVAAVAVVLLVRRFRRRRAEEQPKPKPENTQP